MKFVPVEKLPDKVAKKSLKHAFAEFMAMNVKFAKVDITQFDYKSPAVARNVLGVAAKRHCVDIKVHIRNNEVYFERTDM